MGVGYCAVAFLAENEEDAQSKALVGMGVLAGTSIALLGIVWGSSIIVGRCDFDAFRVARDKTLTQTCALKGKLNTFPSSHTFLTIFVFIKSEVFAVIQLKGELCPAEFK